MIFSAIKFLYFYIYQKHKLSISFWNLSASLFRQLVSLSLSLSFSHTHKHTYTHPHTLTRSTTRQACFCVFYVRPKQFFFFSSSVENQERNACGKKQTKIEGNSISQQQATIYKELPRHPPQISLTRSCRVPASTVHLKSRWVHTQTNLYPLKSRVCATMNKTKREDKNTRRGR